MMYMSPLGHWAKRDSPLPKVTSLKPKGVWPLFHLGKHHICLFELGTFMERSQLFYGSVQQICLLNPVPNIVKGQFWEKKNLEQILISPTGIQGHF
jgi:hypothetical protein